MPYYMIEDFQYGLDLRKSPVTAPPGTLRKLVNAHITPGGEVEKAKGWALFAELPPGTHGLHAVRNQLFTFGETDLAGEMPPGITYQRIQPPLDFGSVVRILDTDTFDGKPYVITEFSTGQVSHFYDGVLVPDWDVLGQEVASPELVRIRLVEQINTTTPFTAGIDGEKIQVTSPTDNAPFFVSARPFSGIRAEETVPAEEGVFSQWEIELLAFSPGQTYLIDIRVGDPQQPTGKWSISLPARVAGISRSCKTFGSKMYAVAGSILFFSSRNDPTKWLSGQGQGLINLATHSGESSLLTGIGIYQNHLAVFSRRAVQVWSVGADPDENVRLQVLENVGSLASGSVRSFGNIDLFFLSDTGVRSLRARDSSNLASAQDVGSSIDSLVRGLLRDTPQPEFSPSAIEPENGKYLLSVGGQIIVFSHFPGAKVSAWAVYDPGLDFTDFAVANNRLYARAGDNIYLYGGPEGDEYPSDVETEVQTPFLSAETPGTQKTLRGLDVGCEGEWDIYLHPDPASPELNEHLGTLSGTTYGFQPRFMIGGQTTHFSLRFVHKGPGYARLSNVAVHYDLGQSG